MSVKVEKSESIQDSTVKAILGLSNGEKEALRRLIPTEITIDGDHLVWNGVAYGDRGVVTVNGETHPVRLVWWLLNRVRMKPGYVVEQVCGRELCLAVGHLCLMPETIDSRETVCPRGHLLELSNIMVRPDGRRSCKTCYALARKRLTGRARRMV